MKIKIKDVNKLKEDLSKLDFVEIVEKKKKIIVDYKLAKEGFSRYFGMAELLRIYKEDNISIINSEITSTSKLTLDHLKLIIDIIYKNREVSQ